MAAQRSKTLLINTFGLQVLQALRRSNLRMLFATIYKTHFWLLDSTEKDSVASVKWLFWPLSSVTHIQIPETKGKGEEKHL